MGIRKGPEQEITVSDDLTEELCKDGERRIQKIIENWKEEAKAQEEALMSILIGLFVFVYTAIKFWNFH